MAKRKNIPIPSDREAVILQLLVGGEQYGLEIQGQYEARVQERMPLGSLYTTLERMQEKGLLASRMGESSHERGGNRRRYFRVCADGLAALDAHRLRSTRIHSQLAIGGGL